MGWVGQSVQKWFKNLLKLGVEAYQLYVSSIPQVFEINNF